MSETKTGGYYDPADYVMVHKSYLARLPKSKPRVSTDAALDNNCPSCDELRQELTQAREALQRIHDMAERPQCLCGRPTGTTAIKQCARAFLARREEK
jgi:hypothetical protein